MSVPDEVADAIRKVLDYNWEDEYEDARDCLIDAFGFDALKNDTVPMEDLKAALGGHVFADLVTIDNWLRNTTNHAASTLLADEYFYQ